MSHKVAPSILSSNFGNLHRDFAMVNDSEADWFHVDVMDGVFVPNISFGFPVIKTLKQVSKKPLDVHLMIVEPERYISQFAEVGSDVLTVHEEASTHLHRTIQAIHAAGMKAGVALNPHTSVNHIEAVLEDLDLVCLMSVNPGFGGQKFIEHTYKKIEQLAYFKATENVHFEIEIDGGVTLDNKDSLLSAGATVLVAGSTVFNSPNPADTISALKK